MKTPFLNWRYIIVASLLATACTQSSNQVSSNAHSNRLATAPAAGLQDSPLTQLSRYRGQSSYLNPLIRWQGLPMPAADAPAASGQRVEQESDIFKVGKPGSKLLYLLNNYRGLQVVSFADGAEAPKLVGRVNATGNYPSDMYYDAANDRLIVLERMWKRSESGVGSRLISYDVKNPAQPKISQIVDIKGRFADSRIVGDVLYVAASADLDSWYQNANKPKGIVYSYQLNSEKIALIDQLQLSLPTSYSENMNIISTQNGADTKYYLVAVLSETGWGWWDRNSLVEVVDISDAKGTIKSVMSVSAKGRINERSQTTIKNNTLIVTSQYTLANSQQTPNPPQIQRLAVETFKFPEAQSEMISQDEAQFRQLNINRSLVGLTGDQYDKTLEQLVADPILGIKGRFVKTNDGLRKIISDSVVTVGDTTGLSAQLQDVRYQDGFLYAFWVPSNQVDPLDIFDISAPENGVTYISRLQFDGWISKAIPIDFGGHKYILGLGWVVPNVDNENGRRVPQAMLFEIVKVGGKYHAQDIAQLNLEGANVWTNFNAADKFIEFHDLGNGLSQVLFAADRSTQNTWVEGGQLISLDLNKAEAGEQPLFQGSFLKGDSGWVRRIFTNPEIDRINTFSDTALGTFAQVSLVKPDLVDAVNVLELARNLRAYETVKTDTGLLGVQIISDYNWMNDSKTQLRLVDPNKADAEKAQVLSEVSLAGSYTDHAFNGQTGELTVLTTDYESIHNSDDSYTYQTRVHVGRFKAVAGVLTQVATQSWIVPANNTVYPFWVRGRMPFFHYRPDQLVFLPTGELIAQVESSMKVLDAQLNPQDLNVDACGVKTRSDVGLKILGEKVYLASSEVTENDKTLHDLGYERKFIAPLSLTGAVASCGAETNIPGEPLMVTNDNAILTQDTWVQDIKSTSYDNADVTSTTNYDYVTTESLMAVKVAAGKPSLNDESMVKLAQFFQVESDKLVYLSTGETYDPKNFIYLGLDADAFITQSVYSMSFDAKLGSSPAFKTVVADPAVAGGHLALVSGSEGFQLISFSKDQPRPAILKLSKVNELGQKTDAVALVESSSSPWFYYSDNDKSVHFTPELESFELSQGMSGLTQIFVVR